MAVPIDQRDWWLITPIEVKDRIEGELILDYSVIHSLGSDEPLDADLPRVKRISRVERTDGQPVGLERHIELDLLKLAVDAVIEASADPLNFLFRQTFDPNEPTVYGPASSVEQWRKAARVIRFATLRYGPRMKWTPIAEQRLIEMWTEIAETGTANATDLADALGTTPERLHAKLSALRKQGVELPEAKPGRPLGNRDKEN